MAQNKTIAIIGVYRKCRIRYCKMSFSNKQSFAVDGQRGEQLRY